MSSIFKFDLATALADARDAHNRRVFRALDATAGREEIDRLVARHVAAVEKIRAAHAAGRDRPSADGPSAVEQEPAIAQQAPPPPAPSKRATRDLPDAAPPARPAEPLSSGSAAGSDRSEPSDSAPQRSYLFEE